MRLFDDIPRNDFRSKRQNEPAFDYMNISARPGIDAVRILLENWFDHLSEKAKPDIRGRFRSRIDIQNSSSFFELFWHELLMKSGYDVEIHPAIPGVCTAPDFLVSREGYPRFYLEATLATPPRDELAADKRVAELHDTLNRMETPDYFLQIDYRGDPQENINGRNLRKRLEDWLQTLDFETIAQTYKEQRYREVPSFDWSEAGCTFTFTPLPKGPRLRGQSDVRPVGMVFPEFRWLSTHKDIRAAIDGKAKKYGELDLPLVVAVNVTNDLCDDEDVWSALFGDDQIVVTMKENGQLQDEPRRALNGAWRGPNGPRNRSVSVVIVIHQLYPTTLRSCGVKVVHHPWAFHPLPKNALQLSQNTIDPASGQITVGPGMTVGDILGICEPWPVPDLPPENYFPPC